MEVVFEVWTAVFRPTTKDFGRSHGRRCPWHMAATGAAGTGKERERESLFGDVKVFLAVTVAAAATAGSGQEACF